MSFFTVSPLQKRADRKKFMLLVYGKFRKQWYKTTYGSCKKLLVPFLLYNIGRAYSKKRKNDDFGKKGCFRFSPNILFFCILLYDFRNREKGWKHCPGSVFLALWFFAYRLSRIADKLPGQKYCKLDSGNKYLWKYLLNQSVSNEIAQNKCVMLV